MNASTFDRMAASYAAIVTEEDMLCAGCGDDPCNCRECDVCYELHHRDDLHSWNNGEELLCDECNETRVDDQLRWVGIKPSSNPVKFFEACSGPGRKVGR